MNLFWSGIAILLWGLLGAAPPAQGAVQDPKHSIVDVIAINGEEFVVKDDAGTEGKIHVGSDTEKYGQFQAGDRIDAWVYPNGHAKTIIILRSAKTIQEDQRQQAAQQQQGTQQQAQRQ